MKKLICLLLTFSRLTIGATISAHAQPGALDNTFGLGGIVTTDFGDLSQDAFSLAIQADGKIVVTGFSDNVGFDFILVRYNIDGTLDTSFGNGGQVSYDFGGDNDQGQSVAIQDDGKIVVAGFSGSGANLDFALLRCNNDGSLDTSFSADGKLTTDIGYLSDMGFSVVLQDDGKILVAGNKGNYPNIDFALVRYCINGDLDSTFDADGIVTTSIGAFATGRSVAIQGNGKILVAGYCECSPGVVDFALVRYNFDGAIDSTFDSDGIVVTDVGGSNDEGHDVKLQNDGKIVVTGSILGGTEYDFGLVRYNIDGSLDNTFDLDGMVITDLGANDGANSAAIQDDGKIIAAGSTNQFDFALTRYYGNGSLDSSFDSDGVVVTDVGLNWDIIRSVKIQQDGKIVVAGYAFANSGDIALARYNAFCENTAGVLQSGITLIANDSGATYIWIDCDNGNMALGGAINQSYTATINGNYAVIVNDNGCIDTSICFNINSVGLEENHFANSLTGYPNPTNGILNLSANNPLNNASIKLINIAGQTLIVEQNLSGSNITFDITGKEAGIYFLEITEGANVARIKVVKQ